MKIKKMYQGVLPEYKILNEKSESNVDTYSCDYINNNAGGGSSMQEYSTEEKVVGKWIDNKPVYERVISKALNGSANLDIPTGNVDFYVRIEGCMRRSGTTNTIPIMTTDSNWYCQYDDITSSYIRIKLGNMMKSQSGYILLIVRYTKTTD